MILNKKNNNSNIKKYIEEFAYDNSIKEEDCDFLLLGVQNHIKSNFYKEFTIIQNELIKQKIVKTNVISENIEIKQIYNYVILKKTSNNINLKYEIVFEKYNSNVKIILHPESKISYENYKPNELLKLLYQEFNKIKALHKIVVKIFDEKMVESLKILVKYLYKEGLNKKIKIELFDGIEPTLSKEGMLTLLFKDKKTIKNSSVVEVDKDELLIEYVKPIFGKKGFNCYGQMVSIDYFENKNNNIEEDNNSIYIVEDGKSKKYYSNVKGFVHFFNNKLSVKNQILLTQISRNEKESTSAEKNNIEINVSQEDLNKDSVGEGVSLKSEVVHIDGFVGAKSIIRAEKLTIDGATHKDSLQFAKIAKINRHKGNLRCHNAKINILEGGVVHSTFVEIDSCIGGSIYAKDVVVKHVKNNTKIYASNSITINFVSGEDNLFFIGYKNIPILIQKIKFIDKDIEEQKYILDNFLKTNEKTKAETCKENINLLKEEKEKVINSFINGKIKIIQPLKGMNKIIFELKDGREILFKTENKQYGTFCLKEKNGDYELIFNH